MAQSLSQILLHLIFCTKDRYPFIDGEIRPRLFAYMAAICQTSKSYAYCVGGAADHVHIACLLPRTLSVSRLVEEIKKDSSKWIKEQGSQYAKFYWQHGYGAFSLGFSQLDSLIGYIKNQEAHHQKETFQDEFRRFLKKYQVQYDERYVWE
jgi:REP element-mobilizing transposase RayT